jgi:hypothetical protein
MLKVACVGNFNLLKRIMTTQSKQHGGPILGHNPWVRTPALARHYGIANQLDHSWALSEHKLVAAQTEFYLISKEY